METLHPSVAMFIFGIPPRLEHSATEGVTIKEKTDQLNELLKNSELNKDVKDFSFISNKRFFCGNVAYILEADQIHLNETGLKNVVRLIHDRVLHIIRLPRNKNRKKSIESFKQLKTSCLRIAHYDYQFSILLLLLRCSNC